MNPTSPRNDTDELDRLLSAFFKAQLKKPWPSAPATGATTSNEPSGLVAARASDAPRNAPAAPRDHSTRARYTLAASIALMIGTGWFLSDGFQPGTRPANGTGPASGPKLLPDSGADGADHPPLKELEKDKAKENDGGIKLDTDKFGD